MTETIALGDDAAEHLRTRSIRYPGVTEIDPAWTLDVVNDPERLVNEPDPRSAHTNSARIVGDSPAARMVITIVALREATGATRRVSAEDHRRRPAPVPGGRPG